MTSVEKGREGIGQFLTKKGGRLRGFGTDKGRGGPKSQIFDFFSLISLIKLILHAIETHPTGLLVFCCSADHKKGATVAPFL